MTTSQIEGRRAVIEALRAGRHIDEILLAAGSKPSGAVAEIARRAQQGGVVVREIARKELEAMSSTRNPQGVIAMASGFDYASLDDLVTMADRAPVIFVALDGITDPQNLGAIARVAEGAGAHALVIGKRRAAGVTPAAEKASAGALEHLPVAQVTNLSRALEELKSHGVWIAALVADTPQTVYDLDVEGSLCVVIGSEGRGTSRLVTEHADHVVSIPMAGRVQSLNAAAAAAIALFEIGRRRRG